MHRHLVAKVVGAVGLLTALGGGAASAFTASNSVPNSYAGAGVGTVSGYVVSNIHYTLTQNANNSGDISGVSFPLSAQATQVGYVLYGANGAIGGGGSGAGGPGTCVETANSYSWTCTGGTSAPVTD